MATSSKLDNARFMQPLLPTFLNFFAIPKAFLKRLEKELKGNPIESVVLTTEDQPRRHWLIEVEGGCCFKEGWKDFCGHYGLQVGDFVVFSHQLNLIFQVSVFDPVTACQRCFSSSHDHKSIPKHIGSKTKRGGFKFSSSHENSGKRRSSKAQAQANSSVEDQRLSCRITLTSVAFNKTIIYLPKKFVRSSGLERRCCDVKLIDGEGKAWQVKFNYRKYDSQAYIRGGWKQFQAANSLRPRDSICFRLLERGRWPIMKCYRVSSESKA